MLCQRVLCRAIDHAACHLNESNCPNNVLIRGNILLNEMIPNQVADCLGSAAIAFLLYKPVKFIE